MGHCVTALIARQEVVRHLREGFSLVAVDLPDGWLLVPLEDDDLDGLGVDFSKVLDGFNYLSDGLSGFFEDLSRFGDFIYFETGYFGGAGHQGACAFSQGMIVSRMPATGNGAINGALRYFGVTPAGGGDEFDHMGLSRHRHTSDWKEAAT